MANIIKLLPEAVANQIAAGEVIQRPASVVKELMENAIDAGSSSVQLIVKNAGKTLIQLIDNGKGMNETDARMCFERHATSKISSAQDIFSISTKGFRGEALASIASIAQVELKTKREEDDLGTSVVIHGSEVKKQEFCETPKGTSITVKNLFYNTPARRKFLKKDATELFHLSEEFKRIALAHPNIRFHFYHNDEEIYHLPAGNSKQRVVGIFGKIYSEKIIPINEETEVVSIGGFIGKQGAAKSTRGDQYLFVNNRFIKSPYLNHAIKNAYKDLINDDHHPFYVIFLEIPPDKIDINIHPTKQEIKFEEEKLIYNFLRVTVKHGLGTYLITPVLDFEKERSLEHINDFSGALKETRPAGGGISMKSQNWDKPQAKWETLYLDVQKNATSEDPSITLPSALPDENAKKDWDDDICKIRKPAYQIHRGYIINQIKSGFVLIHQQNAHERILYEQYLETLENTSSQIQTLLFPITLELKQDSFNLFREIEDIINQLGFDVEGFGGNAIIVRGIPMGMEESNTKELVNQLIDQYKNNLNLNINIKENVAMSLAKSGSIKMNKQLDESEMNLIIDQLFSCKTPFSSPSGKKCFITYELSELEKQF